MNKISVKALGKTIEHEGEVILAVEDMPVNCMVLFVDMDTWRKIKEEVRVEK